MENSSNSGATGAETDVSALFSYPVLISLM